jgi:hypothetical protein
MYARMAGCGLSSGGFEPGGVLIIKPRCLEDLLANRAGFAADSQALNHKWIHTKIFKSRFYQMHYQSNLC